MPRPIKNEFSNYFQNYINLTKGNNYHELLIEHNDRISNYWESIAEKKLSYSYDLGKWTVRQLFQHVIDTERILSYRALSIARQEAKSLIEFDQDDYATNGDASLRDWKEMVEEWKNIRRSTNYLFKSFTEKEMKTVGRVGNNNMSVNALGFIIFGHSIHHIKVLKEKYLTDDFIK